MAEATTFFETVPKSFADVKTEPGVDTVEFLQASEGLVALFEILGSTAFSPVTSDLTGNIKKVRTRYLASPDKSATLESLVENEKPDDKKRTATQGLMWLVRGLKFTAISMRFNVDNTSQELSESFTKGYEGSLKQYHSMLVRPVFGLAMKACPYRADFYKKLGSPPERVQVELVKWLDALEKIVAHLEKFYETGGHAKGF